MRLIKFLVSIIILSFGTTSFANFGQTCTGFDNKYMDQAIIDKLRDNSIFGVISSIIDIDNCGANYSGGCQNNNLTDLTLCFKKKNNADSAANVDNSNMVKINAFSSIKLGDVTNIPIISSNPELSNIMLTVGPIGNRMCVVMPTQYGYAPLLCRNTIAQPQGIDTIAGDMSQCSEVSRSCNLTHSEISKTPNGIFGNVIQCVYESLDIIFFDPKTCDGQNMNILTDNPNALESKIKPFAEFYLKLRLAVFAGITIYVIFFGIKMMISPDEININEIFIAAAKVILVIYFSIGIVQVNWFTGKEKAGNGVTQFVLPMMISFVSDMSNYLYNNMADSNLCYFDVDDYDNLHKYYAIWDSIDCRFNTYLGIGKVFHKDLSRYSRIRTQFDKPSHRPSFNFGFGDRPSALNPAQDDSSREAQLKQAATVGWDVAEGAYAIVFFPVIFCMLLGGGFIPFLVLLFMMLIIIGLLISTVMSFVVSLMILYILAYIAPIFVPMSLFQRTKGYFDGWLNLTLSSVLQPVIILAFASFIMMIIDGFLFDSCVFVKYKELISGLHVFDLWLPDDASLAEKCQSSIGFKLFQYYQLSGGWTKKTFMFFEIVTLKDVWDLQGSCWTGIIMLVLMRYVLNEVYNFSASLSGGMNISGFVVKPTSAIDSAKAGYEKMKQGAKMGFSGAKSLASSMMKSRRK